MAEETMQNIDIRDFTTVSSVEGYDHVVLSLFGGSSAKMTVDLFRKVVSRGMTPSIAEDGTWHIGEEATGVTAEGKTPVFRKGVTAVEWKYTHEDDSAWRTLVEYSELRIKFDDLTEEQRDMLRLKYSDLTEEEIAELQQPASDMIAKLEETDAKMNAAEDARIEAEESRVAEFSKIKKESATVIESADAATESANAATQTALDSADTANTAAQDAIAATDKANSSADNADAAADAANTAAGAANTAANTANIAASSANEAASNANAAASDATVAASEAESARDAAITATNAANESASVADAAATKANEAAIKASSAADNADAATEDLNVAKDGANAAAQAANASASNANVAASSANEAASNANAAASDATVAASEAESARGAAITATNAANESASVADAAATNANEAADAANTAALKARNLPVIQNGTWWLYDVDTDAYVDSGYAVSSDYQLTREKIESVYTGNIETHWHDRYVDKVEGKQLTTEDFTTVLKEKLEGLYNYDDTAIKQQIGAKQDSIDDLDAIRSGASFGATALQEVPSEYVTESELSDKGYATATQLSEGLSGKVDSVEGKGLSAEDFTTALKSKLEGLENYNDGAISDAVNALRSDFDELVGGDTTSAIESFNEVVAFLSGVEDSESLEGVVASIEKQIAAKQDAVSDLDAIRSGASLGATALQSVPSEYVTDTELTGKGYATTVQLSEGLAQKQDLNLYFTNLSASTWVKDEEYEDYPYRCDLVCQGVDETMYAQVVYDVPQWSSGEYAPVCETKTNIVSVWSAKTDAIVIPTIIINK